MASAMYVGVGGKAEKIKKLYVGVDGKARKVKKLYVGVNGKAQLVYIAESKFISYSGTYIAPTSTTTINGKKYNIYTLTKSGTLKFEGEALYWMCAGGGGGGTGSKDGSGGGGAGGYIKTGELEGGSYVITIGVGGDTDTDGTATKIGSLSAAGGKRGGGKKVPVTVQGYTYYIYEDGIGGDGASGGGCGAGSNFHDVGKGEGETTRPFGLSSMDAHSAGGAGGQFRGSGGHMLGGKGGSDGSDGLSGRVVESGSYFISGGEKGGGTGGGTTTINGYGRNATFYGSGGGGAGASSTFDSDEDNDGGKGYQGVVYIAIPVAA